MAVPREPGLPLVFVASFAGALSGSITGFGIAVAYLMVEALLRPVLEDLESEQLQQWAIGVVGLVTCSITAVETRQHLPWRWVGLLVLPTTVTSPAGILTSLVLDTEKLLVVLSVAFFVVGSQQLWAQLVRLLHPSSDKAIYHESASDRSHDGARGTALILCAGAGSGFLGGLLGMGGPVMQLYVLARPLSSTEVQRSGVSSYFVTIYLLNLVTLSVHAASAAEGERLRSSQLISTVSVAVIGTLLGVLLGGWVRRRFPHQDTMSLIIIALLYAACGEIWAVALTPHLATLAAEPGSPLGLLLSHTPPPVGATADGSSGSTSSGSRSGVGGGGSHDKILSAVVNLVVVASLAAWVLVLVLCAQRGRRDTRTLH